jgi:tryptophan 2-monooxygenase
MLQSVANEAEPNTKGYMYNWSADRDSRGGFKLDWAGETEMCIQLANHYKTSNESGQGPVTKPYLFVAGDSMSHLGGWLEGAFMSSIAAFTGMLVSLKGVDGLSPAGLTLFKNPIKYVAPK